MNHLYHGSTTQNIKVLEPRKRFTPAGKIDFDAIYASPLPAFAAAHSFPWSSEEGIGLDVNRDKVVLSVPMKFADRVYVPVSIYKLSSDDFEQTKEEETGFTWHTTKNAPVIEEQKYGSVMEAIKQLGGEIEFT
jgi:hypothetical protein